MAAVFVAANVSLALSLSLSFSLSLSLLLASDFEVHAQGVLWVPDESRLVHDLEKGVQTPMARGRST